MKMAHKILIIALVILGWLLISFVLANGQVVSGRVGVFRDSIYVNGKWVKNLASADSVVKSFNGRTGAVVPAAGDYNINQLSGVSISSPTLGQLLQYNGTNWTNWTPNYTTQSGSTYAIPYIRSGTTISDVPGVYYWSGGNAGLSTGSGIRLYANAPGYGNSGAAQISFDNGVNAGWSISSNGRYFNGIYDTLFIVGSALSSITRFSHTKLYVDTIGRYSGIDRGDLELGGGDFRLTGGKIFLNGSAGTTGQVLTSQGAGTPPIWTNISSRAWSLMGNAGTTAGTNFIGTTDSVDMVFKTKNIENMRITATGNVGIGTTTPAQKLDVNGSIRFTGSLMPLGDAGISGSVLISNGAGVYPIWSSPFYINEPAYQTVTTIITDGATIPTNYNVTICKFSATTPNVYLPTTSLNNSYGGRLRIVVYNFTNDTLTVNPNGNLINGGSVGYSIPVGTGKTFQWSGDGTIGWMVY